MFGEHLEAVQKTIWKARFGLEMLGLAVALIEFGYAFGISEKSEDGEDKECLTVESPSPSH